jgi:type I restriction enzyme S subunit
MAGVKKKGAASDAPTSKQNAVAQKDLPEGWVWKTLGEIAEVIGGGTPRTNVPAYYDNGTIPWITPADLSGYSNKYISKGARSITEDGLRNSSARLMPKGSVLFTSRAPIGYVAIASNPVATNQGFKSFVLKEGILPDYVYWYLKGAKQLAESMASGTTFLELSGAKAKRIPIPLAPPDQQTLIVAEIEKQFSRLDEAVAGLKRIKANLKRYKAAVLKAAVEGKLTEEWRSRRGEIHCALEGRVNPAPTKDETGADLLKRILAERKKKWEEKNPGKKYKEPAAPDISNLPQLPKGWVWASMGQCFRVAVGATPSRKALRYWNGEIPWVSSGEVQFSRIRSTREHITEEGLDNSSTQINPVGSVLLGMIGEGKTRGQSAILEIPAANNQNCAAIWVSETQLKPEFIYYWFMQSYEDTRRIGSGNNQQALNKAIIEMMPFPLPSSEEHIMIVETIERRLSVAEEIEATVEVNLKRAEHLRQSVLKKAFDGKLKC